MSPDKTLVSDKFRDVWDLANPQGLPFVYFEAPTNEDAHWGTQIGTGDVNGDDIVDVIITATWANTVNGFETGAVYVFFGPWHWDTTRSFEEPDAILVGEQPSARTWGLLITDLDQDGIADIITGHVGSSSVPNSVNVVFGRTDLAGTINLATDSDCKFTAPLGSLAGASLASGDLDADGLPDLAIFAPSQDWNGRTNCGMTYIVFGSRQWPSAMDLTDVEKIAGPARHSGMFESAYYPNQSLACGDFNGDGIVDIAMSLAGTDAIDTSINDDRGAVFMVFGRTDWPILTDLALDADVTVFGLNPQDHLNRVQAADINADGITDLILGAHGVDRIEEQGATTADVGEVYLVRGRSDWPAQYDLSTTESRILGARANDEAADARAADLDGDSYLDIIIGYQGDGPDGTRADCGAAAIVAGRDLPATIDLRNYAGVIIHGPAPQDGLTTWYSLHDADLDANGSRDLLLGVPRLGYAHGGGAFAIDGRTLAVRERDIALVSIDGPNPTIGDLEVGVPAASLTNLGQEAASVRATCTIRPDYTSTQDAILAAGDRRELTFAPFLPLHHGSYLPIYQATLLQYGQPVSDDDPRNDRMSQRVWFDPIAGIKIDSIRTGVLVDGEAGEVVAAGRGFVAGATAQLRLPGGQEIAAALVSVSADTQFVAQFDVPEAATEGPADLTVINPDGAEYEYQGALNIVEFAGQVLPFGDQWTPFSVIDGTTIKVAFSVPDVATDLFVLIKKITHIGYASTWRGRFSVLQGNNVLFEQTTSADFNYHLPDAVPGLYLIEIQSLDPGEGLIQVSGEVEALESGNWTVRDVQRPYGSDWTQLEIPAGVDVLRLQTEGVGIWSHLDIYRDRLGGSTHWRISRPGQGYRLRGVINSPASGTYYLKYSDSAVMQGTTDQVRDYLIIAALEDDVGPPPIDPVITDLSTYVGSSDRLVTVTVRGAGFDSTSIAALISRDAEIPAAETKADSTGRQLVTVWDLSNAEPGDWSFVVRNSLDHTTTAPRMFTITSGGEPELWVEVAGRTQARVERWQRVVVNYGNSGLADALGVILFVEVPAGCEYRLLTPLQSPEPDEGEEPIDWSLFEQPLLDDGRTLISVLIPVVSVGQQGQIELEIFAPMARIGLADRVTAAIVEPLNPGYPQVEYGPDVGSVDHDKSDFLSRVDYCAHRILHASITFIPYADCILAYWDLGITAQDRSTSPRDLFTSFGNIVISCCSELTFFICEPAELLWDIWNALLDLRRCIHGSGAEQDEDELEVEVVGSGTPEDKIGPSQYRDLDSYSGTHRHHVEPHVDWSYRVEFWNREDATAPAAVVTVVDTLDVNLDPETLSFREFGFREWTIPIEGGQYFNIDVDMQPEEPWLVNVEGRYDPDMHAVVWVFRTLDPQTREEPEDPLAGFLPPITSAGTEIGWVSFSITPVSGLDTGDIIRNQAFVNFDGIPNPEGLYWAPAPKESPWVNLLDLTPPTSRVEQLPAMSYSPTVMVPVSGEDAGAGINRYEIYASGDGDPFELVGITEGAQFAFGAENGASYRFYSIAVDHVGHREPPPADGGFDAMTTVQFVSGLAMAPSPFVPSRGHSHITLFGADLHGGIVDIFDKAGDQVQRIEIPASADTYEWDGRSRSGDPLASGVYIWVLQAIDGTRHTGKFAVIR